MMVMVDVFFIMAVELLVKVIVKYYCCCSSFELKYLFSTNGISYL